VEVSDGMERFSARARIVFFVFFHLKVFLFPGLLGLVSVFCSYSYSFSHVIPTSAASL